MPSQTTTQTTTPLPTWAELIEIEPQLVALLADARRTTSVCPSCRFYGRGGEHGGDGTPALRARVKELAGFVSAHPNPVMRTMAAYDVVYHTVYDAIPDRWCRLA